MNLHYCLAFVWGAVWASFLQFNRFGRWLALKRTWLTVVVGVGVDLLIVHRLVSTEAWARIVRVIAWSSLPIILRSLLNELSEALEVFSGFKNPDRK